MIAAKRKRKKRECNWYKLINIQSLKIERVPFVGLFERKKSPNPMWHINRFCCLGSAVAISLLV